MRKKIKIIIGIAIILALAILLILLSINPEQHFKITKQGIEVDYIDYNEWQVKTSELTQKKLKEHCLKDDSYNRYVCGEYLVEIWNQIK
ncbi:hypothetical protein KJ859_02835 [Patescibacteria group bacterium]|nr:hypothetical protein [Patescibacteria group bacterium]